MNYSKFALMRIATYIFSLLFSVLILNNNINVSLTYAYYEIDPIGFIEALCENQDKPEMQCNGKCHLKKVAKTQDNNKNTPESLIDFKELVLFHYNNETIKLFESFLDRESELTSYKNFYSFLNSFTCFHPPRA